MVAKNDREVRSICFEGPAGLLSIIDPDDIARDGYARSTGETSLRLQNGTLYSAFTADRPDNLRGYAFDGAWFDEFSSWPEKMAQNVVDNIWFCLREAPNPRVIITTTPKPVTHIVDLLKRSETDPTVVVTRGSTMDNAPNLSGVALDELIRDYDGTRLGRQELHGELLLDVEGALWAIEDIENNRATEMPETLAKIYVAVDPAITSGMLDLLD